MLADQIADFDALFAPIAASEFFIRYWQHRPLVSPRGARERFSGIVDLHAVDELISSITSLDKGWLLLTKDGVSRTTPRLPGGELADLAAVHAAYNDGTTLILTMLQQRWPAIRALCRRVERELVERGAILARPVAANLYLTPPGSRGFDPHYDDHDVIILHIEGEKRWRIYGSHRPRPMRAQTQRTEQLPALELEHTVEPGQVIYLPRGVYHEAATGESHSLHLTLSIAPTTWIDLMTRMLPSVEPLREALPLVGSRDDGGRALRAQFDQLLGALREHADPAGEARRLADESVVALRPLPDDDFGRCARLGALAPSSRVRRRRGTILRVHGEAGRASLVFPGGALRGPEELLPLFAFIGDHESFRIDELPDTVSTDSKLELTRRLVGDGLLYLDPGDGAAG